MSTRSAQMARKNPRSPPDAIEADARTAMDNMYRWTRHVYDASRKYYLLGRDTLIRAIRPAPGEVVIEAGCGTARNLRKMAVRYPEARFYGFDASDEMLKTAHNILKNNNLQDKVIIKQALAQEFDPVTLFGLTQPPDKIVFSYALSIIPPWRESLDHALAVLKSGGEIHIVDFGGQDGLPPAFRTFLFWWLDKFHVYNKPEILDYLRQLDREKKGTLKVEHLYKAYAYYAVFKKTS